MKKTTSKKLSKRLLQYGAFSAAIMGTTDASGQIVYTDIADETVDAANARVAIDINNDMMGDVLFGVGTGSTGFAFVFPASSSMAPGYNANLFNGFTSGAYAYPSNLTAGTAIDGTNPTFGGQRGDFNYGSCGYPNSQFCDGMDGYVGVHFDVGGNTHYGWIRIQVASSGATIVIKDYAYNATPGDPIEAGQTLSVTDFEANNFSHVYSKDTKTLSLESSILPLTGIEIYNVLGKVVINKSLSNTQEYIDMSTVSDGIYLAKIKVEGGSKTIKFIKN
ncbi:T9SS type A sorting domain-containing protein [Ichthyenterobacterium sp. W332]|uniref:T9SS type A sorting domain-containing protein n=1 Tax=Microcosmobacter mediterraneus TaxID=3075607 RepID=A0ABU2YLL2_9FLAO|nr:T9SS type A sorting domain-containing protein [Ichthyenterobacterium sp. W332]MDT0559038.1 T9SS type A sorting domain-containing protein [Ichthyenterobacterium sp. W332]